MAACDKLRFTDVSAAAWQQCKDAVRERLGLAIDQDSGTAEARGFTVTWAYTGAAQTLELQCTDHPFLVPCALVNGQLTSLVESVIHPG